MFLFLKFHISRLLITFSPLFSLPLLLSCLLIFRLILLSPTCLPACLTPHARQLGTRQEEGARYTCSTVPSYAYVCEHICPSIYIETNCDLKQPRAKRGHFLEKSSVIAWKNEVMGASRLLGTSSTTSPSKSKYFIQLFTFIA